LAYIAAVVCFCVGVIVDARTVASAAQTGFVMPPAGFWWAIGGTILFAIAGYQLKRLSRLFYVYEFEHSHND
jgi:hypothetical protein